MATADRWPGRTSLAWHLPVRRYLDAMILLGLLAAVAGVGLSVHTMWGVDVTQVYDLLRS
jgi:hypothetical protein